MSIKELIVGGVVTLAIGGSTYTINKTDVVDNFANDTGVTQQQAEDYVNNVKDEDLVPYDELGNDLITEADEIMKYAAEIDCVNYQYEWESPTLSCMAGKDQLLETGNDEIALGKAYITLSKDSATETDINHTIGWLDEVNTDYDFPVIQYMLEADSITETKQTNSYNKSLLQAALAEN